MNDFDNHRCRPDYDSIASIALRKIFIGGLSYGTDDDKLRKYFGVYGTVQDAVVMKDPVSRRSRGFGFITFTDIQAVDNALAHEPHTIDARKVEAKRAVPRSEVSRDSVAPKVGGGVVGSASSSPSLRQGGNGWINSAAPLSPSLSTANLTQSQIMSESRHACDPRISMDEYAYNKIFVGGLHYDTRDAEFRSYFERFGRVMSAEVMFNRETHKSRGFGFIVFELERGAEQVCAEREHVIDGKVVEVKRAIPRSRIGPNGAMLSPTASPQLRPSGQLGQAGLARPTDLNKAYAMTDSLLGIANANAKLRQDVRRSASVGNPSMLIPQGALKPSVQVRRGLEASIASIGVPSPRSRQASASDSSFTQKGVSPPVSRGVGSGASYATALRTGAGAEDSESSITDQMLIASLQSDLLDAIGSSSSDSNYMFAGLDTSCVIQRPPRSLSEPVIQLPGSMLGADYFQNHLMSRMGVGALGGSFNPQSPAKNMFESDQSLSSRSPLMSSQTSPRSPLGLAWLSTPPLESNMLQAVAGFPPLSLPASQDTSTRHSYQQQLFDTQSDYFRSPSGQRGQREESIIPSPSAWASMLMTPLSPADAQNQREQQYFNTQMPPQGSQIHSEHGQHTQQRDYPYLYEQHHQQLQQQQLQIQQQQQQQQQLQQQQQRQNQYFQQQSNFNFDKSIQNALNDDNFPSQHPAQWGYGASAPAPGSGSCVESGAASRSGSLLESVGHLSLTSGTTDRDELFMFEDMRLDGDAPEFEPQTQPAPYRAW